MNTGAATVQHASVSWLHGGLNPHDCRTAENICRVWSQQCAWRMALCGDRTLTLMVKWATLNDLLSPKSHFQTPSEASNQCGPTCTPPASVAHPQQIREPKPRHSCYEASVILHTHCVPTRLKENSPQDQFGLVFMSSELERRCYSDTS